MKAFGFRNEGEVGRDGKRWVPVSLVTKLRSLFLESLDLQVFSFDCYATKCTQMQWNWYDFVCVCAYVWNWFFVGCIYKRTVGLIGKYEILIEIEIL